MHIVLCCYEKPDERSSALQEEIITRGHSLEIIHSITWRQKINTTGIDAVLLSRANLDQSLDHVRAFDVLCALGVPGLNKAPGALLAYDKATSHALMLHHGLPVPESWMAQATRDHQGIVRKPLYGASGRGIEFFEPGVEIPSPQVDSLDQQLILPSRYLRVYASKRKAVGMITREVLDPMQVTVLGNSSRDRLEEVPENIRQASCKAVSVHGCDYLGIDWLIDQQEKPWLIEVNIGFGWSREHHPITKEWINLLEEL